MQRVFEPLSADPSDFCLLDTETRGLKNLVNPDWGDVTKSGAHRYSHSAKVVLLTYAIGKDSPAKAWELEDFDGTLKWVDAPDDLLEFMSRALSGKAWFVMWNSGFDRNVCNHSMLRPSRKFVMPNRTVIDAMAQAVASNLPAGLGMAAKALGFEGKLEQGKSLIKLFAPADGGTPQSHPKEWADYVKYGLQDTEQLRDVFFATRPLWSWEWEEFWASEAINDRGLPIDRPFIENAAELAREYAAQVNERVVEFTHGDCYSVNQHVALAKWVRDHLSHLPEAADILVKKYDEDDETGDLVPASLSLERKRVEMLIPYLERLDDEQGLTEDEYDVLQLLETRLYGASATPKKFPKMIPMLGADDRLRGQYVFNGAQQTGRFSARGVQTHNLTRATVSDEEAAIEFINDLETDYA